MNIGYFIKNIPRQWRWFIQRRTRGFDDSELWSLDNTIAKFILPRLKRFKYINIGYPHGMTEEEWDDIIQKMIDAFELIADDNKYYNLTDDESKKISEGLDLFNQYYSDLWI